MFFWSQRQKLIPLFQQHNSIHATLHLTDEPQRPSPSLEKIYFDLTRNIWSKHLLLKPPSQIIILY